MNNVMKKAVACTLAGTLFFAGNSVFSQAATGIALAGAALTIEEAVSADVDVVEKVKSYVKSEFDYIAVAQVNSYVNIRDAASEEGNILGKIYNNSAADILGEEDGWYKVSSGTVVGYVKKDFFVTGEEAEALAVEIAERKAVVNTTTLNVREEADADSTILALVGEDQQLDIIEETDGWAKVTLDADLVGYVSKDYIECKTIFEQAESIEEEEARIWAEQEAIRLAEEEARRADEAAAAAAAAAAEAAAQQEVQDQGVSDTITEDNGTVEQAPETSAPDVEAPPAEVPQTEAPQTEAPQTEAPQTEAPAEVAPPAETSGTRQGLVSFAMQFVGNPYVWGGTSLTNGADCSGFVQALYSQYCGISIPRVAADQSYGGTPVSLDAIQPGDLLFYSGSGGINHVTMYIGNGQVVHASNSNTGIIVSNYNYRQPVKAVSYLN